jgi:hypothetical protein
MWVVSQQFLRRFQELLGMGTNNKESSKVEEMRPRRVVALKEEGEKVSTLMGRCTL